MADLQHKAVVDSSLDLTLSLYVAFLHFFLATMKYGDMPRVEHFHARRANTCTPKLSRLSSREQRKLLVASYCLEYSKALIIYTCSAWFRRGILPAVSHSYHPTTANHFISGKLEHRQPVSWKSIRALQEFSTSRCGSKCVLSPDPQ